MKGRTSKRILSALLSLVMLLSLLPVSVFATETETTATWTKVALSDIAATDTVAITMTKGDTTWVLPTTGEGFKKQPLAATAAVADGKLTTSGGGEKYGWTITAVDGGYHIKTGTNYLYLTADNNGVRIGTTEAIWSLSADSYLTAKDTSNTVRYLGVYDGANGADWRCYKNTTGNIAGQTLAFYKLNAATVEPTEQVATPTGTASSDIKVGDTVSFTCETVDAALQYKIDDGTYQPYTSPVTITTSCTIYVKATKDGMTDSKEAVFNYKAYELVNKYVKTTEIADGDQVVIYNAGNGYAVSSTILSKYYLTPVTATVTENVLTADSMDALVWTVTKNNDGTYTFVQGENTLAMNTAVVSNKTKYNLNVSSTGYSNWKLTSCNAENNSYYMFTEVTGDTVPVYLEYYLYKNSNTGATTPEFSAFRTSSASEKNFGMTFYKLTQDKQYVTGETPTEKVADPTASPAAGEVAKGTKITFSCATEGATILYKTTGEYQTYTDPVEVTEDTTFIVKATKTGMADSAEVTFTYTVKAEAGDKYVLADTIDTGDQVVIYYPTAKKIMTTEGYTYTNKNTGKSKDELKAADATVTGSELTTKATNAAVLTVTKDANGKYTFTTADGKFLYMDGTHVRLVDTAGANTLFQLEPATNGWFIKADTAQVSNKAQYLEYFGGYFTVFGMDSTKVNIYTFQFYKLARATDPVSGLQDGDKVAIYNDANAIAIGTAASSSNLTGVATTLDGEQVKSAAGMAEFTVRVNDQNQLTFVCDGKYLTAAQTGKGLSLAAAESDYSLWVAETNGSGFYLKNVNAAFGGKAQYLQVYSSNFSTFGLGSDGDNYTVTFRKVAADTPDTGDLPTAGSKVVIYSAAANAALAAQDDNAESPSITKSGAAEVTDGKLTKGNGAAVFTVEQTGEYLRFKNDTYGYLCANGTGNNAFYSKTASEDADWLVRTCSGGVGGFELESRTAKFNGKYSQWMEYYSDSFKVYSMDKSKVTDYTIYSFYFYPVAETVNVTGGIVNQPAVDFGTVLPAYVGQDYELTFTVDAPFGVDGDMTATLGEKTLTVTKGEDGKYTAIIPVDMVKGDKLTVTVSGKDTKNVAITGEAEIEVKDEPSIVNLTPANGEETGDNKRPTIGADVINAGDDPTILLKINDEPVDADYADGKVTYTPAADMADGKVQAALTVTRADGKSATAEWSFTVGEATYQRYFGQLHGHTQYSDGAGSLTGALDYIAALPESANVQFVAFTDHSNYFDSKNNPNVEAALYDTSLVKDSDASHSWNTYKSTIAAFNAENTGKIVAIGGFEMTWSGGPGHINTFNTPGVVSRNNSTLNNKTSDAGLQAYYALLSQSEGVDSISQFNHPGTTFGNFKDFNYWNPVIDSRMYMVEVGNGEGQVGAGGYYPSYEQYILALDKGWHVAPTNNQDNHKGRWGNANDARDVILTDDFSEAGIYEAIQARRMYATEDKNLEIDYTVNNQMMGSIISEVPEKLEVKVSVHDPDKTDTISKVELVANSGKVIYTWDTNLSGELSAVLDATYSYYFVRVTEADGDLAVTAPVWVGETLKLGISDVACGTSTPVTNEELTLTTTLFNSEKDNATVKSLKYTIKGGDVLSTDAKGYELKAGSTLDVEFKYTPTAARVMTITVEAVIEQNGEEFTFTKDIELDVLDANGLVYIGIDASHYNEYVAGNYKDSMGNFGELAAGYSVRTVQLNTSDDLIAACSNDKYKALILTAPSRRLEAAQADPKTYSEDELVAIAAFNAGGGTVILAGWSDNYENYPVIQNNPAIKHMAATQNEVLAALGSSLRISDDATYDDVRSAADGVDKWRLYFSTYNMDNLLNEGVIYDEEHPYDKLYTERFSHYGGASIYAVDASGTATSTLPATVSPVVYGHASTYSVDVDEDKLGGAGTPKYAYAENDSRLLVMATEQLEGKGLIVVSGAAFMSNFEVQAQLDNGAEKNYSNYKICENLIKYLNPIKVTPISKVQKQTEKGYKFTIEGIVTSNASGYDKNTAFFDCIYVQDTTGGINCFPVAGDFKIGDKVRVTGKTDFYQGEIELQVTSIEKIGDATPVTPQVVTATQVNDGSVLGSLITVKGVITRVEKNNGLVETILVKDADGKICRVFIDGYITTDKDVVNAEVGREITVTGIASYDDTFVLSDGTAMAPRIRIRDRADVVCGAIVEQHEHVWGAWTTVKKPTCTEPGTQIRYCTCGSSETQSIPATGHTYVNGKCKECGAAKPATPAPSVKPATPVKSGTTADTSNMGLWLVMLSLSLFGSVTLLRSRKRRA